MIFVKAVYTVISSKETYMRSMTDYSFSIGYVPETWIKPKIKSHLLFVFEDAVAAMRWYQLKTPKLPYRGPTFWWAEALGARYVNRIFSNPPERWVKHYWDFFANGHEFMTPMPKGYEVWGKRKNGILACEAVKLVEPIENEQLAAFVDVD